MTCPLTLYTDLLDTIECVWKVTSDMDISMKVAKARITELWVLEIFVFVLEYNLFSKLLMHLTPRMFCILSSYPAHTTMIRPNGKSAVTKPSVLM